MLAIGALFGKLSVCVCFSVRVLFLSVYLCSKNCYVLFDLYRKSQIYTFEKLRITLLYTRHTTLILNLTLILNGTLILILKLKDAWVGYSGVLPEIAQHIWKSRLHFCNATLGKSNAAVCLSIHLACLHSCLSVFLSVSQFNIGCVLMSKL